MCVTPWTPLAAPSRTSWLPLCFIVPLSPPAAIRDNSREMERNCCCQWWSCTAEW